jgi:hypothetical protein
MVYLPGLSGARPEETQDRIKNSEPYAGRPKEGGVKNLCNSSDVKMWSHYELKLSCGFCDGDFEEAALALGIYLNHA